MTDTKINLHLICCFHTIIDSRASHCAFSSKCLRFARMIRLSDLPEPNNLFRVIEYSNGKSESEAHEHVKILEEEELPKLGEKQFFGDNAVIGTPHWTLFDERLKKEMILRVKKSDIICFPFGNTHNTLKYIFPNNQMVETGIGYPDTFLDFKIYESSAWEHFHSGKANNTLGANYCTVIGNYYDTRDWYYNPAPTKDYVLFFGRLATNKGIEIVLEVAKRMPKIKFILCGQGDPTAFGIAGHNVEYRKPLHGKDRYELVSNAACMLTPTLFIEPFCGSHVEAMMTGVPIIASNRGVFWETIVDGFNGYVCRTLGDYISAVVSCCRMGNAKRNLIAENTKSKFSLEVCGKKYISYFKDIVNINNGKTNKDGTNGWYLVGSNHQALPSYTEEEFNNMTLQSIAEEGITQLTIKE